MKQPAPIITALLTLTLSACGGSGVHPPQQHSRQPLSNVNLPISADHWTDWHCTDGSTLRTRYQDHSTHTLRIEHPQTGAQTLHHEPGRRPAIYSNGKTAFYSDGQHATLGYPLSDSIISGGCTATP